MSRFAQQTVQNSKDIQFTVEKENQKMFTFKKLEPFF